MNNRSEVIIRGVRSYAVTRLHTRLSVSNLEAVSAGLHVSVKITVWILFKFCTEIYTESILLITAHYARSYKIYGSTLYFMHPVVYLILKFLFHYITTFDYCIVTCRGVRVTKITGSRLDDWIYWHFGYTLTLNYN
jgi:hypothetical protein